VDSQLIVRDQADRGISASSPVGRLLLAFLDRTLAADSTSVVVSDAAGRAEGG
jgi:hypothetical protein